MENLTRSILIFFNFASHLFLDSCGAGTESQAHKFRGGIYSRTHRNDKTAPPTPFYYVIAGVSHHTSGDVATSRLGL